MPVPTADLFDKQQDQQTNGTHPSNPTVSAAEPSHQGTVSESYFGSAGSGSSGAQNNEANRALTREEADRLYEERMEEEYAKRDGGA